MRSTGEGRTSNACRSASYPCSIVETPAATQSRIVSARVAWAATFKRDKRRHWACQDFALNVRSTAGMTDLDPAGRCGLNRDLQLLKREARMVGTRQPGREGSRACPRRVVGVDFDPVGASTELSPDNLADLVWPVGHFGAYDLTDELVTRVVPVEGEERPKRKRMVSLHSCHAIS